MLRTTHAATYKRTSKKAVVTKACQSMATYTDRAWR
jgi:hypothetical protein